MNKKKIYLIFGAVAGLAIAGGIIFFSFKRTLPSVISPVSQKEEAELLTWEDPAGFSFSYSEEIEIDSHEEDEENYAHLELTSANHSGKIIVLVKDTKYTKIEDWAKKEIGPPAPSRRDEADGEAGEEGQVLDTELGGEPAKKVAYTDPEKLVTATIDIDALVLIEMFPDKKGFWQEVLDQILDSFTFIPLEGEEAPATTGGGGEGIIWEAEEVIE